jgi:hypothetical protein
MVSVLKQLEGLHVESRQKGEIWMKDLL